MSRARILFGEHSTQRPAIEAGLDSARFEACFTDFDDATDATPFALVVPLSIPQVAPARNAAARAERTDGRRRAVLPDDEQVAMADDKLLFHRRLTDLGFGELLPALLSDGEVRYPYVLKARRGDFGQGIRIVRSPDDEPDTLPSDSFRQEAVEGSDEYVLHLLRVDGRVRYRLCYRYAMGASLTVRGAVDRPRSIEPADDAPAIGPCTAILDALGFEGTCCFNYKLTGAGLRLIELNPRFGGSLVGDIDGYLAAHLAALAG